MRPRSRAVLLAALAGCHVRTDVTATHPGAAHLVAVPGGAPRAGAATVTVAADGRLRFVEPLRCPADRMIDVDTSVTHHAEPNLATAVVGIVLTVAGGVALATGLTGASPAGSGYTWLGAAGAVGGLPFAIGPWLGNGDTEVPVSSAPLREGAGEVDCGERPVAARTASVRSGRFQAFGGVGADGTFEVSPFSWTDAFAVGEQPALDLTADLVGDGGVQTIDAVVEASRFAGTREAFFAAAGIDARVETMRKVPRLEPGAAKVSRRTVDGRPYLRIVVPIDNTGPGDAWQVRGAVEAEHPEIDGRILYVGHVGKGAHVDAELLIPLSVAADRAVSGGDLALSIVLREAHGAAPDTPVRFSGKVLEDVPR